MRLSRRGFVSGLGSALVFTRSARAADFTFSQYHNQVAESPLHRQLVAMWDEIRSETGGRVETHVYAQNNNIPGSDPQALRMLVRIGFLNDLFYGRSYSAGPAEMSIPVCA